MDRRVFLGGVAAALAASRMAQAEDKAGTLHVSCSFDITSFDPMTGRSGDDHIQLYTLYDTLVGYDFKTLQAVPSLATQWSFPDPKRLVMDLRDDVKFHDGTAFDAEAVKFNLDRIRSSPKSNIKADVGSIDSVEVTGPHQVTLHLKQPDTALPLILADRAGMMVSPAAVAKSETIDRAPVGTGMMKFVDWRDKEGTTVVRNDAYWKKGFPKIAGIRFNVINDMQTGLRSVTTGENDLVYALAPQQLAVAKRSRGLETVSTPTLYCQLLYFNYKQGPMSDVRVRQAINYAIDRDEFNKGSALGLYEVANTLLPKEHWAYNAAAVGEGTKRDVDKARKLMAEAGLANGVDLALIGYSDQSSQQRAEILIEQFRPIGIRIRLTSVALPEATAQYFQSGQGDMLLSAWTGRPDPTLSYALMFGTGAFYNASRIGTPELDAAIAQTRLSSDQAERAKAFATVQTMVRDQALFAPLVFQSQIVAHTAKVQGYEPTLLGKPRFDGVSIAS
jgi:ABC-type transport system substrate-binding protein